MRSIDVHAHLTPQRFWQATEKGGDGHTLIVHTESALRFLVDTVGADRVVFGTDWPYDMALDWPVSWILAMESLTQAEKEAILWRNLERLLDL